MVDHIQASKGTEQLRVNMMVLYRVLYRFYILVIYILNLVSLEVCKPYVTEPSKWLVSSRVSL